MLDPICFLLQTPPIQSAPFVLYRFVLCESTSTFVLCLRCARYVFAYLLVLCKFCLCIVILALKYRTYRNKEQLRCDFSESDGKEIPNLQVIELKTLVLIIFPSF